MNETQHVTTFKSRIAPTPSGFLHLGNAYSFVLTWLWNRLNNGKLLLRIDDMDGERCRNEYVKDIFETLQFLGIDYDEGPKDLIDFKQHFTQIERLGNYRSAIDKLKQQGNLYACICSRKDKHTNLNSIDPLNCKQKNLPLNTTSSALRINIKNETVVGFEDVVKGKLEMQLDKAILDFVIQQKNGLPAYQICSLIDDTVFGITHIVRGEDLLASTAAQLYLANLLGEEKFLQTKFLHHPLIKATDGNKLSKSAGDTSIKHMRSNGVTARQIIQQLADVFGIKHCEAKNIQELLQFIIANDGKEIGIFAMLK